MFAANPLGNQISSTNVCEACGRDCSTRCGRCKVVFYCGACCQKRDNGEHKLVCKEIAKLEKVVNQEEQKLKSCVVKRDGGSGEPENLFETVAGAFG